MGGSLSVKFRKIIFWSHLLLGALAGIVILVMSFTGICLAFESQILGWAEHPARNVSMPSPQTPRLSLDDLFAKARAENPETPPTGLTLQSEPGASVMANFGRDGVLFLNPYTGETLGHGSKLRGVFRTIENCHRWLGANEQNRAAGRAITGTCNFVFFRACRDRRLFVVSAPMELEGVAPFRLVCRRIARQSARLELA
jgi:uncharacterized iron-regulated membrane protein